VRQLRLGKPDFSERSYTATATTVTFYTHPSAVRITPT
jgi:hypothetical protein